LKKKPFPSQLLFFIEPPHDCNYLPHQKATTLFTDPRYPKDRHLQTRLFEHGFRRSGDHLYRPHCQGCQACIPVRVPVADFRPRRSQRRAWQRNRDLTIRILPAAFDNDHFLLYRRYIHTRHLGGGMENPTPDQYLDFLTAAWAETLFVEFRLKDHLLALCVLDCLDNGLSSVYTFFDPDYPERSLGVYTILWTIYQARHIHLSWLYLGFWIETSPKMCYKNEYQPQERFQGGSWEKIPFSGKLNLG